MRSVLALLAVLAVACGAPGLNIQYYRSLNTAIEAGDFQGARKKLVASKELYGEKSRLIWHMDNAMIAHLEGDVDKSNRAVQAAEKTIEELYAKSLTREASSFLTSDASLPYEGEDYEKVFLNVLGALNYALAGNRDEAVVEAKRADLKLQERARRYKDSPYSEDAFVRYLMGLIYEDGGEINDAWISYARAIAVYEKQQGVFGVRVPAALVQRAARAAKQLGFFEELQSLRDRYGELVDRALSDRGGGRLVLVEMAGMVPFKVEQRIEMTLASGIPFVTAQEVTSKEESDVSSALSVARSLPGATNIVIAFPTMQANPPVTPPARISVRAGSDPSVAYSTVCEVVHNLGAIAPLTLKERMGAIWGRTVARAVVKFLLAYAAQKAGEAAGGKDYGWLVGALAGAVTTAALSASEHADTRQWGTLPYEVRMAVLDLPEGVHEVELTSGGQQWKIPDIKVTPGRATWRVLRTP